MSPEQVEGKPLDPRSDIYSFGVTCYHMLTGAPPFRGETALGVAVQHLKTRPQPLESLRPDLPPALCRIVHQMLAKDPTRRFATARELLRELRRVQMEHFGDDWPEDLPAWESLAAEMPADPRIALTEQLSGLMKAAAPAEQPPQGMVGRGPVRRAGAGRGRRLVDGRTEVAAGRRQGCSTGGLLKEKNVVRQWYRRQPDRHRGRVAERDPLLPRQGAFHAARRTATRLDLFRASATTTAQCRSSTSWPVWATTRWNCRPSAWPASAAC